MVIKSAANKSALKGFHYTEYRPSFKFDDIAASKGLTYEEILKEVETIVNSGTKLNLNYYIDEMIDEDKQEEVYDYFKSAEVDSIDDALVELGSDDYTREEVQLMRIKFLSEVGN
jgi:ATP-dependent DNA helicase RecQ